MTHEHEAGLSAVATDRALHPRHYGPLHEWSGHARITGPCGDTMEFWVDVRSGHVRRTSFVTDGCGSARAAGDMAATLSEDRTVEAALAVGQADVLGALGGLPAETEHCALLAANTLRAACRDFLETRGEVDGAAREGIRTQEETR
jgi:nitrogen fixation protein NifU and related proteins